jgi:hypothetical protein
MERAATRARQRQPRQTILHSLLVARLSMGSTGLVYKRLDGRPAVVVVGTRARSFVGASNRSVATRFFVANSDKAASRNVTQPVSLDDLSTTKSRRTRKSGIVWSGLVCLAGY